MRRNLDGLPFGGALTPSNLHLTPIHGPSPPLPYQVVAFSAHKQRRSVSVSRSRNGSPLQHHRVCADELRPSGRPRAARNLIRTSPQAARLCLPRHLSPP